ncbi:hypothetical protein SeMB42_g03983 [Synchytrium endobioticum]|uniref:HTH APSES-type domain-containing protein n=1 Tax=Synchytrium endobioticum TaxID=286115 RepID=A0A507D1Y3_9FUNG|nr:hypothetical protein SeMB42_g03983 [Synchytrium endobioticum]
MSDARCHVLCIFANIYRNRSIDNRRPGHYIMTTGPLPTYTTTRINGVELLRRHDLDFIRVRELLQLADTALERTPSSELRRLRTNVHDTHDVIRGEDGSFWMPLDKASAFLCAFGIGVSEPAFFAYDAYERTPEPARRTLRGPTGLDGGHAVRRARRARPGGDAVAAVNLDGDGGVRARSPSGVRASGVGADADGVGRDDAGMRQGGGPSIDDAMGSVVDDANVASAETLVDDDNHSHGSSSSSSSSSNEGVRTGKRKREILVDEDGGDEPDPKRQITFMSAVSLVATGVVMGAAAVIGAAFLTAD